MNEEARASHRSTLRQVQLTGHIITTAVECIAIAEIVWFYLHDGEQTLHGAVAEWWENYKARARERDRIRRMRDMIRDLPETDET